MDDCEACTAPQITKGRRVDFAVFHPHVKPPTAAQTPPDGLGLRLHGIECRFFIGTVLASIPSRASGGIFFRAVVLPVDQNVQHQTRRFADRTKAIRLFAQCAQATIGNSFYPVRSGVNGGMITRKRSRSNAPPGSQNIQGGMLWACTLITTRWPTTSPTT